MDRKTIFSVTAFCSCLILWNLWSVLTPLATDTLRNPFLINKETGKVSDPGGFIDLNNIIQPSKKYLDNTSPVEHLYNIIYQWNLLVVFTVEQHYSNDDQLKAAGEPYANQSKCHHDLQLIEQLLDGNEDAYFKTGEMSHRITRYLGSFGQPQADIFSGSIWWTGSYTSCLASELTRVDEEPIKTRYCWTRWRFDQWSKQEPETMIPKVEVRVGACLPRSCDTRAFDHERWSIQNLTSRGWPALYKEKLSLTSMFCLPDEESPIRRMPLQGYLFLSFLVFWILILVVSSVVARRASEKKAQHRSTFKDWIRTFSAHEALKRFMTDPRHVDYKHSSPELWQRVDMSSINFYKVFFYALIVLGHTAYQYRNYVHSLKTTITLTANSTGVFFTSLTRLVDTFFVIFSLLAGFNLAEYFAKDNKKFGLIKIWFFYNLRCLMRIGPVYYLVYFYTRWIGPYLSASPWWDYGVASYSQRELCMNEPWWRIPLYTNRLHSSTIVPPCNPSGWFLVFYLQVSLVIPFFIWLMNRLPNELSRILLVAFISLASLIKSNANLVRQKSIPLEGFTTYGGFLLGAAVRFQKFLPMDLLDTLGLVVVGSYTGYLLHRYQKGTLKKLPHWLETDSCWYTLLLASLNIVILFAPVIGRLSYEASGELQSLTQIIVGNVFLRLMWPIVNSLFIMKLATGLKHTQPVRFMGHPFWVSFNKLGLCIYLVHWEILVYANTWNEHAPPNESLLEIYKSFSFVWLASIVVAFLVHILFESPMNSFLAKLVQLSNEPSQDEQQSLREVHVGGNNRKQTAGSKLASLQPLKV